MSDTDNARINVNVKAKFAMLAMLVMCAIVFVFSGCGGSADNTSEETTEIPYDTPDTYHTALVLDGSWALLDQEVSITADLGDDPLDMYLVTASLIFSDTEIFGSRGISTITTHESWRMIVDSDTRRYLGIVPVNIDNQVMSMIKSGADKWRCELSDVYKTVMNIEILAENLIQITEHRLTAVSGDQGVEYDAVLTFRKKEN